MATDPLRIASFLSRLATSLESEWLAEPDAEAVAHAVASGRVVMTPMSRHAVLDLSALGSGAMGDDGPAEPMLIGPSASAADRWTALAAGLVETWIPVAPKAVEGIWIGAGRQIEPATVAALRRLEAGEHRGSPLDPECGRLVHLIAAARRTRRALDIGAGPGASGLWLRSALVAGGELVAIERDSAVARMAQRAYRAAGVEVKLLIGDATRLARDPRGRLGGRFHVVLVDGEADDRRDLLAQAIDLAPGGVVISRSGSGQTAADALLKSHPQVAEAMRLHVGEGLHVALVA